MSTEHVTDHGAAGDGTTDDTQAIIDAANAAGAGGTVYFPAGTYLVGTTDPFAISYPGDGSWDGITWQGEDYATTTIKQGAGWSQRIRIFQMVSGAVDSGAWKQLTLDQQGSSQSTDDGRHIYFSDNSRGTFSITDCRFLDGVGGAMKDSDGQADYTIIRCEFNDTGVYGSGSYSHDLSMNQSTSATVTISYCRATHSAGNFIDVGRSNAAEPDWVTCNIDHCYLEDNRGAIKLNSENDKTTITHSQCIAGPDDYTSMVMAKFTDNTTRGGDFEARDCYAEGGYFPAVDWGGGGMGTSYIDNCHFQNTDTSDMRGAGIFAEDGTTFDAGTFSCDDIGSGDGSSAVKFKQCSGTISEVRYDDDMSLGKTGAVSVESAAEGGTMVSPDVVAKSETGPQSPDSTSTDDGSSDTTSDLPHRLKVTGTGVKTNYTFSVSKQVQGAEDSLEEWDEITDDTVEGWVTDTADVDKFDFSGEVTAFDYIEGGPVDLVLNGESVSDDEIVGLPESDDGSSYGGYAQPDAGTSDWHLPVNENFGDIEADILDLADRIAQLENN